VERDFTVQLNHLSTGIGAYYYFYFTPLSGVDAPRRMADR
jgi:hypothetical protein